MVKKLRIDKTPLTSIIILFLCYMILALFMGIFLDHDFMISDVAGYWQDSLNWKEPFHTFHVPGYPLLLAFIRGITFNLISPVVTMMLINLIAFLSSAFLVFKILERLEINSDFAFWASLLFGLWPLVGLTYTVSPLADMPAISLFLLGIYFIQKSKIFQSGITLGLCMLVHKAMWPFVALLVIIFVLKSKKIFSIENLIFILLALFPITILWAAGSLYHQSPLWIISSNVKVEMNSRGSLPILDGIIGTILSGGSRGMIKGSLLFGFGLLSAFLVYFSLTKKQFGDHFHFISITIPVFMLFLILNQHEVWAAVRFSRLLAVPLMLFISNLIDSKSFIPQGIRKVMPLFIFGMLLVSQFVYGWYIARVFFE